MASNKYRNDLSQVEGARLHCLQGCDDVLDDFRDVLAPELIRQRRPAFDRDFAFLMACVESETDFEGVLEALLLIHFGLEFQFCDSGTDKFTRRLIERFDYVSALAGRPYRYRGFGKRLAEEISRLYENIDPTAQKAGRVAFERDLAFLVQAAQTEHEMLYSLQVMAMVHWRAAVEKDEESALDQLNDDLNGRLDYVLERRREGSPRVGVAGH